MKREQEEEENEVQHNSGELGWKPTPFKVKCKCRFEHTFKVRSAQKSRRS